MKNKKAVAEIWQDDDGWWVRLKSGYGWGTDDTTIVNGEDYKQLCEAMRDVHRVS